MTTLDPTGVPAPTPTPAQVPPDQGNDETQLAVTAEAVARTQWQLFRRRFFRHKLAMVGLFLVVLLIVLCFGARWIAPYPRNQISLDILDTSTGPSGDHLFGLDEAGRDYFTEVLYAGQLSLKIGGGVALMSTLVGVTIGLLAGFYGKILDQLLMRATDLFLIVPQIAVLAVVLRRFPNSELAIILILAALFWMPIARIVRGQVLSLKQKEFIDAARAIGCSNARIMGRHLLPNLVGPIMVNASLQVAVAIITESTLSFLGFGVQPPKSSWGNMLSAAKGYVGTDKSYLIYFPGLFILTAVLAVNFLGDGLRDAFDPQAKH